ncbi:hypothetical protein [Streptomyces sp. NPDC054961]
MTRPAWVDFHLGHSRPRPYERDAALLAGVPPTRRALFVHGLTGPGLAALWSLLESGRYELHAPQEAALLCVAWLLRSGDLETAAELALLLDPFADLQPFTPRPGATGSADSGITGSAREAARLLARQRQNPAVAAQREALTVWRPFEDELLAYWLRAHARAAHAPRAEAAALMTRYEALAAAHPLTGRHRYPKSNASVLLRALAERADGRELPPPLAGSLRHAVTSMVAKRGRPGSPEHTRLRQEQVRQAAVLRGPFAPVPDRSRIPHPVGRADAAAPTDPADLAGPTDPAHPAGPSAPDTALPRADALVDLAAAEEARAAWETGLSGVRLPQSAGAALARAYHPEVTDPALRILLAKLYQGGARYCSHLWNFAGLAELPWIRAVAGPPSRDPGALAFALRQLATVTTEASCASVTDPSLPLVRGLSALAHEAGVPASFAAEPFADRDTGGVSQDVLPAARVAAELLRGTPYARYYGIDYAAVRALADADDRQGFAALCVARAGRAAPGTPFTRHGNSPELAVEPAVIEEVRVLTAFNLAALVHQIGVVPGPDAAALARSAFTAARRRAATPARTARAWRHLLFHLSFCAPDQQASVLDWIDSETARLPRGTAGRLAPLIARLRTAMAGGAVGD